MMKITKNLLHNQNYIILNHERENIFRGFGSSSFKNMNKKKYIINQIFIGDERKAYLNKNIWFFCGFSAVFMLLSFLCTKIGEYSGAFLFFMIGVFVIILSIISMKGGFWRDMRYIILKKSPLNRSNLSSRFYNEGKGVFENENYILLDTRLLG